MRRRVMWSIYTTLLDDNQSFFGMDKKLFCYDCGVNFYSVNKLINRSQGEMEFHLDVQQLSNTTREFLGSKVVKVVAKLLACGEVHLRGGVVESKCSAYGDLQQFLDIVLSQEMYRNQEHLIFGKKAYDKPTQRDKPLSGGKVLGAGFQKNVRFVGNSADNANAVIQIDAKKSAFFKEQDLLNLVASICNNRLELLRSDDRMRKKVAKQLKDLVVHTNHLYRVQRNFSIFGLTQESADNVMVVIDGQDMSVSRYFRDKYRMKLRYPFLPCVIEKRCKANQVVNSYFPMECLSVVKGQRVEMKKQTPDLVEELIRSCRVEPNRLKQEGERERRNAWIHNDNPYLKKLGIRISDSPLQAEAKVLYPPAIVYGNEEHIEPNQYGILDWRLNQPRGANQRKFFRPATAPRRWVVFIFMKAVDEYTLDRFILSYIDRSRSHDINLQRPSRKQYMERDDFEYIVDEMNKMRKNGVEYVLMITRDDRDSIHELAKLSEVSCSVVTQHIIAKTVFKATSGSRGTEMTLDNIIMKMNLKLGGLSHMLTMSSAFARANRLPENTMERGWLRASRMFIGLEMSHSSAQSLYERQAGIPPSEPTVVGMAYSCEDALTMRGEYWMQEPRIATVQFLKEHVIGALNAFKDNSKTKEYPEHVLVFRGGVSDGEFAKVVSMEAGALRDAFDAVSEKRKIRLTVVCMMAKSNYRLFRESGSARGNAAEQNVPPGTCVDSGIVHPTMTEFLLIPHKSIMGTARPLRCTVVVDDEPRMSLDELEGISNAMCYGHGIVTSPVSLPAHLYAAGDLAKRGRNNWKAANSAEDDASMSGSANEELGRFRNNGAPDFFPSLSEHLAPKLKYKFWA